MNDMNDGHVTVVGATSAVAQAAIRVWARRGQALTLIARNADELTRIAADARLRGAASVTTVVGDLAEVAFITGSVRSMHVPRIALIAYGSLSDSARADGELLPCNAYPGYSVAAGGWCASYEARG